MLKDFWILGGVIMAELDRYVRYKNNIIDKIFSDISNSDIGRVINGYSDVAYSETASTPQELIKEGDLVELEDGNLVRVKKYFNLNDYVIKIYTPNFDKTVYTLQGVCI